MQNHNLPTEDLKTFGIINDDLTFSKKLSSDDIQKFLNGYTIVADNDQNRATFQLSDNNTKLKVIFLERDKSLSEILEKSKEKIQYSETKAQYNTNDNRHSAQLSFSKQAFVFDKENNTVKELDFIKNASELTAVIAGKKDVQELNRYKNELQKLKNFLYDKMDLYPEIAKEIQIAKERNSDVQLNVNDRDMYEDANRNKEEQEEQSEEQENKRRFRR